MFGILSEVTGLVVPLVGSTISRVEKLAQSVVFAPYIRGQEYEADRVGQDIVARAGWDPAALSMFLMTMEHDMALYQVQPSWPSFFDSHPRTADRIVKTTEHAKTLTRANRQPISPTREAFLARLDGLVVGERAANCIFQAETFMQPDLNLFLQFSPKWQLEKTPQRIVAAPPDGNGAMVLRIVASGDDPAEGAVVFERMTKYDIVRKIERTKVGTLPAAHIHFQTGGKAELDVTWIAHGGLIYQLAGLAPMNRFDGLKSVFESVHKVCGH